MSNEAMSNQEEDPNQESAIGTILGWGGLGLFALWFAWQVGSPLIIGEQWANKANDAIEVVKNMKPSGTDTLYDMIRSYSLKAKERDFFVGEFSWSAIQKEGPEYEVTLLWSEGEAKKVALWRVNLENKEVRPQGEAASLPQRLTAGPPAKNSGS
jgi:hypothetical protein